MDGFKMRRKHYNHERKESIVEELSEHNNFRLAPKGRFDMRAVAGNVRKRH